MQQPGQNRFHVFTYITCLRNNSCIRHTERNLQNACDGLGQISFTGPCFAYHDNVRFLYDDIVICRSLVQALIVIVNGYCQRAFRLVLPDYILFEKMLDFVRRNWVLLSSASLLLASLLLFSVSVRSRSQRDPLAALVLELFSPLQGAVSWLQDGVGDAWKGYVNLISVRRENEMLRARVASLEADLVRFAEVEHSNQRLGELLRFRSALEGPVLGARIIARDPMPWFSTFTVDLGEKDGIRQGMAVLAPRGVVGRVTQVSRSAARVLLLTDHNSGIDAIVQRSRARGIVQGTQDHGCRMNYLRRDVDVVPGDRVVTSGLDGIFPKGVVIGEIAEVALEHRGLLRSGLVLPSVDLDALEDVLIVDATVRLDGVVD